MGKKKIIFAKKGTRKDNMAKKKSTKRKGEYYSRKKISKFLEPAKKWAYTKGQCRKSNRKNKTKGGVNRCALQKTKALRLYERLVRDLNSLKRLSFKPKPYGYI